MQGTINIKIIIIVIIFMQGTYNYIHETNHVSWAYSVVAVLYLQSVLHVMLFHTWNMFCTFTLALSRSMCAVLNMDIIIIIIIIATTTTTTTTI